MINSFRLLKQHMIRTFFVIDGNEIIVLDMNDLWSVAQGEHLILSITEINNEKQLDKIHGSVKP